jgi:hypothetical protein
MSITPMPTAKAKGGGSNMGQFSAKKPVAPRQRRKDGRLDDNAILLGLDLEHAFNDCPVPAPLVDNVIMRNKEVNLCPGQLNGPVWMKQLISVLIRQTFRFWFRHQQYSIKRGAKASHRGDIAAKMRHNDAIHWEQLQ